MIITLKKRATKQEEKKVVEKIKKLGYIPHISKGKDVTIIGMVDDEYEVTIGAEEMSAAVTIEDLFNMVKSKL